MNIKAIVSLLGVNEHTLRAWERRHNAILPARSENGRRTYSAKDVERLKLLVALVNQGHNIGNIAALNNTKLQALLGVHEENRAPVDVAPKEEEDKTKAYLQNIMRPLERFDLENLNLALQKARFELSPKELIMDLILPLLGSVGGQVADGKISIAQEHILSSMLRDHIGQIYQSLSPYSLSTFHGAQSFALTTREGDIHEFAILISAILCALHRKKTHYLGPNMPAEALVSACKELSINNIVLGMAAIPPEKEIVSPQKYLETLDAKLPHHVALWIGGSALFNVKKLHSKRKIFEIGKLSDLDMHLAKGL